MCKSCTLTHAGPLHLNYRKPSRPLRPMATRLTGADVLLMGAIHGPNRAFVCWASRPDVAELEQNPKAFQNLSVCQQNPTRPAISAPLLFCSLLFHIFISTSSLISYLFLHTFSIFLFTLFIFSPPPFPVVPVLFPTQRDIASQPHWNHVRLTVEECSRTLSPCWMDVLAQMRSDPI